MGGVAEHQDLFGAIADFTSAIDLNPIYMVKRLTTEEL